MSAAHFRWYTLHCWAASAHVKALLVFTVLTLVMLYPLPLHLHDGAIDKADPLLNAWILAWDVHTLPRAPLALFDANIFYPYSRTLAYSETLLGLVPFAAPIIWITGNPLLAVNVLCWLSFVLCGWGMFALVYRLTREWWAALIAGVIFAYVPYRFAHLSRLQLVTAQWIPLAFLFLDRLVERKAWRDWALLALVFNLEILSSYYYGLFASVSLAVLLIGYWLTQRQAFDRKLAAQLVALGLITLAVNAPLVLPYFTVARDMDFQRSLQDAVRGGADLIDFVTVPPENWLYGSLASAWRQGWWYEHVSFPGLLAVALAAVGVAGGVFWRALARPVIRYGLLLSVSFTLMLGPALRWQGQTLLAPLPYTLLYEFVPGFRGLRQPARFGLIAVLALSVLAGYGFTWLMRRWLEQRPRWRPWLGCLVSGIMLLEYASWPIPLVTLPVGERVPPVYRWLARQPEGTPVLELPLRMDLRELEGPRVFYSAYHWQPLVNGYSGWYTPVYFKLIGLSGEFPSQSSLYWIAGVGTRYVIVHREQLLSEERARLDGGIGKYGCCLSLVESFGDDQVYAVLQPLTGQPVTRGWRFSSSIALLGYWPNAATLPPGDEASVTLFWQRQGKPIVGDYTVFVHILDAEGRLVAQHDGPPTHNESERPTSDWPTDKVFADEHRLRLPAHLPPGRYEVRAGMYDPRTMQRLSVSTWQGEPAGDSVLLGWITLSSSER